MNKTCRVLLIDDHTLFREGLRRIIQGETGLVVVAEAGTAGEGERLALARKPDLIVLDISLPDESGLELVPRLRRDLPRARLLVVSMHSRTEHIVTAFQAGAHGYVTKEAVSENLIAGIHEVLAGECYLDPAISQGVLARLLRGEHESKPVDPAGGLLTPREREVMRLIAEGHQAKVIAERLGVSPKTVDSHRANIMRKCNLDNTVDIVRQAARLGLIDVDAWKV
ncbi:MAG: response regulator [Solidesulfovibrio sp. DCME]|uniref:response regulator n=1 Tax=Solidesulfovibrio sp. DCME TaxID=3447380 RepID=UPI003D1432E7